MREPASLSFERDLELCDLCPRLCHHACPVTVASHDDTLTPQALMGRVRRPTLMSPAPLDEAEGGLPASPWACTGCGLCQALCAHPSRVPATLGAARQERFACAQEEGAGGAALPAGVREGYDRVRQLDRFDPDSRGGCGETPVGQASFSALDENRLVDSETLVDRRRAAIPGRGLRLFLPDCQTLAVRAVSPDLKASADSLSGLMGLADALGEGDLLVWTGARPCCAYTLIQAGDLKAFHALLAPLLLALKDASLVLTACAHSHWLLNEGLAEAGYPAVEARHLAQHLLEASAHKAVHPPLVGEFVMHAPCHLRGDARAREAGGELLRRIAPQTQDPRGPWRGELGGCAGGGGLLPWSRPELSKSVARVRASDLCDGGFGPPGRSLPGPRQLVTASPCCQASFERAGVAAKSLYALFMEYLEQETKPEGET